MNEDSKKDYNTLVAKKSERLVTALYLVTDLMSDNEPIKHGLRKNSVALLSSMNSLSQLDVKDRVIELKMSLKSVTEIISFLHVALTTGIISEMNGKLLMEGFRSLQLVLEKKQPILTKEMLTISNENLLEENSDFTSAINGSSYDVMTPLSLARLHSSNEDVRKTEDYLKRSHILEKLESKNNKGQTTLDNKGQGKINNNKVIPNNTNIRSSDIQNINNKNYQNTSSSFKVRKQSRREQILALFVKGVDVSIKDITNRIRGCSEKTIQRELNSLLADNRIERIGEKRWSRYILR